VNDYLWDRTGDDPDVARLEALLEPLALPREPGVAPMLRRLRGQKRTRWVLLGAAAAAAVLAAVYLRPAPGPAYDVTRIAGTPRVGARPLEGDGRWRTGEWLETDGTSRAMVRVGALGEMEVGPATRVRLLRATPDEHRLALERGRLQAVVTAPPRLFLVETPAALAVDLGCAYTLDVRPGGDGWLHVSAGAVSLEGSAAISYVPAQASCSLRAARGPGVPVFDDVAPEIAMALERLDHGDVADLERLLVRTRPRDTLTLWHLLPRTHGATRARVLDRIEALVPGGPDRTATLALEASVLQAWLERLRPIWWMGAPPAKLKKVAP